MVKKAIVTAMAVISLFTLMGCNNRAEVDTLSPAQAAELKPMPQSWRGVLPCGHMGVVLAGVRATLLAPALLRSLRLRWATGRPGRRHSTDWCFVCPPVGAPA